MPFRDREQWLRDIVQATDDAESFILGLTFEQYAVDALRKSAAERKLLAASEAAIRLGADAPELIPEHDWRGLRAIGNVIRHAYDGVDDRYIWHAIKVELPGLRDLIKKLLDSGVEL